MKFGIELEIPLFINNRRADQDILFNTLRPVINKHDFPLDHDEYSTVFTLKSDCSCGGELTTPALEISEEKIDFLKNILSDIEKALTEKYGSIKHFHDFSNGLHIHLSRDPYFSRIQNMMKIFYLYEDNINKIFNSYRHLTNYFYQFKKYVFNNNRNYFLDRNVKFVPTGRLIYPMVCSKHNTIEFRHFHGTFVTEDIINWLYTLLLIGEIAKYQDDLKVEAPFFVKVKKDKDFIDFLTNSRVDDNFITQRKDLTVKWIRKRMRNYAREFWR